MSFPKHTVEKIGGTSMSRVNELLDTLLIGEREGSDLYHRIFVVSAFGGITDLLLEHKKSGRPGVYGLFANDDDRAFDDLRVGCHLGNPARFVLRLRQAEGFVILLPDKLLRFESQLLEQALDRLFVQRLV